MVQRAEKQISISYPAYDMLLLNVTFYEQLKRMRWLLIYRYTSVPFVLRAHRPLSAFSSEYLVITYIGCFLQTYRLLEPNFGRVDSNIGRFSEASVAVTSTAFVFRHQRQWLAAFDHTRSFGQISTTLTCTLLLSLPKWESNALVSAPTKSIQVEPYLHSMMGKASLYQEDY